MGASCTATLDPLLQVMHANFRKKIDNNVSNRKRCTYLKESFKTSSKSRNIKVLVNLQYYIPPFICRPLRRGGSGVNVLCEAKTKGPMARMSILFTEFQNFRLFGNYYHLNFLASIPSYHKFIQKQDKVYNQPRDTLCDEN